MKEIDHLFDCSNPQMVTNKYTGELVQVPCGSCPSCKVKKITKWVLPIIRESQSYKYVFFFTLTYSDNFLPKVNVLNYEVDEKYKSQFQHAIECSEQYVRFCNGNVPVCKTTDMQNFIKRLRENIFRRFGYRNAIRYFVSSDYGSTTFRPHWHGLLFTNVASIADNLASLFTESWSVYDKVHATSKPIGIIDLQRAYAAAQYVASYITISDHRPSILDYREFATKSLKSSLPSIGSMVRTAESPTEVITRGLTKVTTYNAKSYNWEQSCLQPSLVRRLFPKLPSYMSLAREERLELYRIFTAHLSDTPKQRRRNIISLTFVNSFLNDYLTLNQVGLSFQQLCDKIDRVHYVVRRLNIQCQTYGLSYSDYDRYIERYYVNKNYESLINQLSYEQRYSLTHTDLEVLLDAIDLARESNARHLVSLLDYTPNHSPIIPYTFDIEYFQHRAKKLNSLIKRKCDNAYLERHPEFKQFHK